MQKTKIEYLDYTWNPLAMRCTPISDGCRNCWHLAMAKRLAKNPMIDRDAQRAYFGTDGPSMNYVELEAPLRLKKPSRIGVQLMGDLFHRNIPDKFLIQIFNAMRMAPKHKYFLLSKRPSRMSDFCQRLRFDGKGDGKTYLADSADSPGYCLMGGYGCTGMDWVWLGVSIENQQTADERIPILLQIPAAKRFVSVEPMLGPVDLGKLSDPNISWIIVGGETGAGARPLHLDWIRSLVEQCQAAGVPFFFKSWGEWEKSGYDSTHLLNADGRFVKRSEAMLRISDTRQDDLVDRGHLGWIRMKKVGKKRSGRLLDGKIWDEMPVCSKDFP